MGNDTAAPDEHPPELAPVRDGEDLDWPALEAYLRDAFPSADPPVVVPDEPMTVLQFPNGSANLTYLLRFGPHEFVLRRPPFGRVAPGAHDMRREYRVLSKLWRVYDRAPRAYVFCDDHDVVGSDFVVMERRQGEVIRGAIPPSMSHHDGVGRRIGFAVVDAMADLHVIDPAACDLQDLGRPDGFVQRQVEGWADRWGLVRPEHHVDPEALHLMDQVPERLAARIPEPTRVSFVHNDLKPDNCQFEPSDPDRVASIFDWDMTTLGEPLVDLGTLLNYWPDPSDGADASRGSHEGMRAMGLPTRAEVVERYRDRTGFDTSAAGWFEAFAQWKTAVVIQQLHDRWVRGESTDPRMESIADRLPVLARGAATELDRLDG
ncbi:MAG: phosphotransferase family protein [Ilumatobacteraceae bacterium]